MEITGKFKLTSRSPRVGPIDPLTKPITIISGKFYEATKTNPPTHMMYSVSWATDVFILDPFFLETGTTLLQNRLQNYTKGVQNAILRSMTQEIQMQRFTGCYKNGIIKCQEHFAILVTASFLNNKINEYISINAPLGLYTSWHVPSPFLL
jgi:hypothetical protein